MNITRNQDGSYSAEQRTRSGRVCIAEAETLCEAMSRCARLVLTGTEINHKPAPAAAARAH